MLELLDALTHLYEATHHAAKVHIITRLQPKLEKALAAAFVKQRKSFMQGFVKYKDLFPDATKEAYRLHEVRTIGYIRLHEVRTIGYKRLHEVLSIDQFDTAFDQSEDDSLDAFVTPLTDAVQAALLAAGKAQIAELGMNLSFTLKNPRAVAYMKLHGADLVANINQTTRDYIHTILNQAVDEGWSYDQAAKAIIDRYTGFAVGVPGQFESRAQRIAVNELANSYEEGNFEPIQDLMDSGIECEKSWDTAPELSKTGTCDLCQGNADEGWIPADQPHQSGDDKPLAHVNCHCDEFYRVKE